jgi:hypothetical protein
LDKPLHERSLRITKLKIQFYWVKDEFCCIFGFCNNIKSLLALTSINRDNNNLAIKVT